jgi:hypothetical protein
MSHARGEPLHDVVKRLGPDKGEQIMRRATRGQTSVHIDAAPPHVYELVSDVTRMGEWSPETQRRTGVEGGEPSGTGTTFPESYVTKPDWAVTNWFNGLLLGIDDCDADLLDAMRTTLARNKPAAEEGDSQRRPLESGAPGTTSEARR